MLFQICLTLAFSIINTHAFFFSSKDWNDLKVTWGVNPLDSNNFQSLPLNVVEATKLGWTPNANCSTMNGNRYVKKGDLAVMLIFGANGLIAGISAGIPKNLPYNFPSGLIASFFKDEGSFLSITAYFVDETTVCKASAPRSVGDRLVIKNSNKDISVPLTEAGVIAENHWTKGKCFYTMGVHYWLDARNVQMTSATTNEEFTPIFLQYNKGQLNGFGWAFNNDKLESTRYERPSTSVLPQFLPPSIPSFMSDPTQSAGVFSTIHIYLDSSPLLNFC